MIWGSQNVKSECYGQVLQFLSGVFDGRFKQQKKYERSDQIISYFQQKLESALLCDKRSLRWEI